MELKGNVSRIGKPYIRIINAKFECPSCGGVISRIQDEYKLIEPKRCSCGRKTGFKIIEQEEAEGQNLFVSERGTEFIYKIYLEKPELIRILKKLNESCGITIKGVVKVEYGKGVAIGDLVIYADKIIKS